MTRMLALAIHHPHPEHRDDLLAAMGRLRRAAGTVPGLEEIGAFSDEPQGRVLAISVWTSAQDMQAGMAQLFADLGEVPFDEWERQPRELLALPEAAPLDRP